MILDPKSSINSALPKVSSREKRRMLTDVLKAVSRSFYLTLKVLPKGMDEPVAIAYLLARAADTIVDTEIVAAEQRERLLRLFRRQLQGEVVRADLRQIEQQLGAHQAHPGERVLLSSLDRVFALYLQLDQPDRLRVAKVVLTLTDGMVMDLQSFPAQAQQEIACLTDDQVLDRYIYLVAGCVGEFWTEMGVAHVPGLAGWDLARFSSRGIHLGKALQLTNVLRDVPDDLRIGRCYLPSNDLALYQLTLQQLLDPHISAQARPLLVKWLNVALSHYEQAEAYLYGIPRRSWRSRLAAMWPLLLGLATLQELAQNPRWLDPACRSKISRGRVYRILLYSIPCCLSNRLLRGWIGRMKEGLMQRL